MHWIVSCGNVIHHFLACTSCFCFLPNMWWCRGEREARGSIPTSTCVKYQRLMSCLLFNAFWAAIRTFLFHKHYEWPRHINLQYVNAIAIDKICGHVWWAKWSGSHRTRSTLTISNHDGTGTSTHFLSLAGWASHNPRIFLHHIFCDHLWNSIFHHETDCSARCRLIWTWLDTITCVNHYVVKS